jgi:hypothetical protein
MRVSMLLGTYGALFPPGFGRQRARAPLRPLPLPRAGCRAAGTLIESSESRLEHGHE